MRNIFPTLPCRSHTGDAVQRHTKNNTHNHDTSDALQLPRRSHGELVPIGWNHQYPDAHINITAAHSVTIHPGVHNRYTAQQKKMRGGKRKNMETCMKCGKKTEKNDTANVNNETWCIDCAYEDFKKQHQMDQAEMKRKEKEAQNIMYT